MYTSYMFTYENISDIRHITPSWIFIDDSIPQSINFLLILEGFVYE